MILILLLTLIVGCDCDGEDGGGDNDPCTANGVLMWNYRIIWTHDVFVFLGRSRDDFHSSATGMHTCEAIRVVLRESGNSIQYDIRRIIHDTRCMILDTQYTIHNT